MDTDKTEIYITVNNIIDDKDLLTLDILSEKYADFKTKFPKLYEMSINHPNKKEFLKELRLLLDLREDVITGRKTDVEANVQTGEYFGKKYVYPITGEPTQLQKKNALTKILQDIDKNK